MNKKEFGALFDTSGSLVTKWEKGTVTPAPDRLKLIAEKGNMSVDDLTEGSASERINAIINIYNKELNLEVDEDSLNETIEYFERNPIDFLRLPDIVLFFYTYFQSDNYDSLKGMSATEIMDFINISSEHLLKRLEGMTDSIDEDELQELSLKLHHLDHLYESLIDKVNSKSE